MPIVDLELVIASEDGDALPREKISMLADSLGMIFGSPPAGTWLRVRYLPDSRYAENDPSRSEYPVFVTVLKARIADPDGLAEEMRQVAGAVARAVGRPEENVHVLYEPDAAGRIGFGGILRRE